MEEKYFLFDILEMEKNMTVNMAISLNEASNQSLYKEYFEMFEGISKKTKELFELAYSKGWYQLENAEKKKIDQNKTKLCNELGCEED